MLRHITLHKVAGETPLQTIEAWKDIHPEYKDIPASYAGRLDPMASGKLLVILGEECKRQSHYTGLDKEYEIEVLLDAGSDTGDVLGMASASSRDTWIDTATLRAVLKKEVGTHLLSYPVYSSKTVHGTPLFVYALSNTLDTIEIPTHEETFYKIQLLDVQRISASALAARIQKELSRVPRSDEPSKALGADFRQDTIRAEWKSLFNELPERSFTVLRLRVICGTGAYMRTLAQRIGSQMGTSALALSISRTRIGRYLRPLGVWISSF